MLSPSPHTSAISKTIYCKSQSSYILGIRTHTWLVKKMAHTNIFGRHSTYILAFFLSNELQCIVPWVSGPCYVILNSIPIHFPNFPHVNHRHLEPWTELCLNHKSTSSSASIFSQITKTVLFHRFSHWKRQLSRIASDGISQDQSYFILILHGQWKSASLFTFTNFTSFQTPAIFIRTRSGPSAI